jgi:hypothetical protein
LRDNRPGVQKQDDETMQIVRSESNQSFATFPEISFRKKRLSVSIHALFDMESAEDASAIKYVIEEAMDRLSDKADAKIIYSVADV